MLHSAPMPQEQSKPIQAWHREAQRLISRGRHAQAYQSCLSILNVDPVHADAHFLIGIIAAERNEITKAVEWIRKAIALDGEQTEYHAHLGRCLVMLKRDRKAVAAADEAARLGPADALTLDTIGCVYSYTGQHETAVGLFRQAVSLKPDDPTFQFNLGASLRFLGHFNAAATAYENAIGASPRFYRAHWALSTLGKQAPDKNHIKRLEQLLPSCASNADAQLYLHHALAKEFDDLDKYDQAFAHLAAGNHAKSQQLRYSIDDDARIFGALRKLFDAEACAAANRADSGGDPTDEPIFIVGMPRTGTTLAERILSSHSEVYSAGELQNFGLVLKQAARTSSRLILDPKTIRRAMRMDFAAQGTNYLKSTRPATGHTRHFIDKMPTNFFYIGFIHQCLPNAKIICLRRNPMDTCLSNFRQLFALNFGPYYDYAYDIMDTGRYYVLFHRLMEHWRRVLPGKVLELQYEKIVADQEAESRRLIEFCGLEWEDACLDFERNPAAVATASAAQVREPIYKTAVGRWKRYEQQLLPLRELFEAENIPIH